MNAFRCAVTVSLVPVIAFVLITFGQSILYGEDLTSLFYTPSNVPNSVSYGDLMTKYWDWWINVPNAPGAPPGTSPFPITECDIKDIGKVVFLVDALKVGHDTNYSCRLDEGKSLSSHY